MILKQLDQKILQSSVIVASSEQISSDLGEEAVILNLKSGVYHGLNEVGASIWKLIQEPKTIKEIGQKLLEEYDVEPEQCQSDLIALLEDLLAAELVVINNETTA
ncbi:thymidylate synthase [Calothrix sp. HK-06]|nr:thymidylate synthase [Calothrix sp. HK-06]